MNQASKPDNLQDQKRMTKGPCFHCLCLIFALTVLVIYLVLQESLNSKSSFKIIGRRKSKMDVLPSKKLNNLQFNRTFGLDQLNTQTSLCPFNFSFNSTTLSLGLRCLNQELLKIWKFNFSRTIEFRNLLNSYSNTKDMFMLTKKNCNINDKLQNYVQRGVFTKISASLYNKLPAVSPFSKKLFNVCSVVGSSGILHNSSCGGYIDSSDYVFRCNAPPIEGFQKDAGSKTNFTTINPISIIAGKYKSLVKRANHAAFIKDMSQYHGVIWAPAYSVKSATPLSLKAMYIYNGKKSYSSIILGHPEHFTRVRNFWMETYNLTSRISTGFYLTSLALSMCNETRLYGFWPFATDHLGQAINYHYYEKGTIPPQEKSPHNFLREFMILVDLHKKGLLKFKIGDCLPQS